MADLLRGEGTVRCLPPGGTVEQRLRHALETGRITDADADEVRTFVDFLHDLAAYARPDEAAVRAVYAARYPAPRRGGERRPVVSDPAPQHSPNHPG